MTDGGRWLVASGVLSAIASLLHLACIVGGPAWYRFLGAGEGMARAAERGEWRPALITLFIAGVLAVWSAFAFSGAGLLPRLPLLRTALIAITAVYLVRGLAILPVALLRRAQFEAFWLWSSGIVLVYGVVHAIGLWKAWPALSPT